MTAILQACLNGGRAPGAHAALPLTPADLAADLADCLAAGAEEAHVHPRGADGLESVAAEDVSAALAALRPLGAPLGLSSQEEIPTPDGIAAAILAWDQTPDYVSVNFHEAASPGIRRALAEKGVGVEAGIWTTADVARFHDGPPPMRILIEIMERDVGKALAEADAVLSALDRVDTATPRLLHGMGRTAWPLLRRAQLLGLSARIGFEDVLFDEAGAPALSNAQLVREALQ